MKLRGGRSALPAFVLRRRFDGDVQKQLADQDAALAGERGGLLWSVSKDDGTRQKQIEPETTPAWDGMAAAEGRLFLATSTAM